MLVKLFNFNNKRKIFIKAIFLILILLILIPFIFKWDYKNYHFLLCQKPERTLKKYRENKLEEYKQKLKIFDIKEDREAMTSVAKTKNETRNLYINGKPDTGTFLHDIMAQYLCGILPYLYIPENIKPDVFILGLGFGSTTYADSLFEHNELLTVEISPSVLYLADKYFSDINHGITKKEKIIIDDGRNYLQNIKKKYDIIISGPSNPWRSRISNLFTEELFKIVHSRLTKNGIFCQWFYYYKMEYKHIVGIIKTLNRVFPHINVYIFSGDIIMIASKEELNLNIERIKSKNGIISPLLNKINLNNFEMVLNYFF